VFHLIPYVLPIPMLVNGWSKPGWAWQPTTIVQQGGTVSGTVSIDPGINAYGAGMRGYTNQPGIHVIENPYRGRRENPDR
jgi:hypothetical protein